MGSCHHGHAYDGRRTTVFLDTKRCAAELGEQSDEPLPRGRNRKRNYDDNPADRSKKDHRPAIPFSVFLRETVHPDFCLPWPCGERPVFPPGRSWHEHDVPVGTLIVCRYRIGLRRIVRGAVYLWCDWTCWITVQLPIVPVGTSNILGYPTDRHMEGTRKTRGREEQPHANVSLSSRQQSRPNEVRSDCQRRLSSQFMKYRTLRESLSGWL